MVLMLLPLMSSIALVSILGGQKPIFFQKRVGQYGRDFCIFKFRTIPDGGWQLAELKATHSRVARIRLGLFGKISAILRATGLDELPQFVNIMRGDMRLIGPRPLMREDFMALPEARAARCAVPPGITGLAQVNGGQDLDPASKLALDIYFIDHASFAMTAEIVARTFCRLTGITIAISSTNQCDLAKAMQNLSSKAPRREINQRQEIASAA
ncbi:Lipid carrier : UDP-N-acetylgalactosaminyltransferase [Rhodovulum sp. P5]|nr:Lipid carrier : UDP-N-acetylgalactosaminyltransferase [Rhodovulum sp. P5]